MGRRYMRIDQKANSGDQQNEPTGNRHNLSHAGCYLDKKPAGRVNDTGHPLQHVDGARPLCVHSQLPGVPGLSPRRRRGMRAPSGACSHCDGAAEGTDVAAPGSPRTRRPRQLGHRSDGWGPNASGDVEACVYSVPVFRDHLGHTLLCGSEKLGDSFQPLRGLEGWTLPVPGASPHGPCWAILLHQPCDSAPSCRCRPAWRWSPSTGQVA